VARRAEHDELVTVVESVVKIEASPEAVAGVLLEADLAPRWTAGLVKLELVSGKPGRVGCVGRAHYRQGGRSFVLTDELIETVPNRYYRSRIEGGGISVDVETTLEVLGGDETRLTLRWSGTGTSWPTRMALPLMRRRIAARAGADLQALRDLVEGSPA
jgi:hypothetical protein